MWYENWEDVMKKKNAAVEKATETIAHLPHEEQLGILFGWMELHDVEEFVRFQKEKGEKPLSEYDYGHVMAAEDFRNSCAVGAFIDYDGHGYYVINDTVYTHLTVRPSRVGRIPKEATHVVWFNK